MRAIFAFKGKIGGNILDRVVMKFGGTSVADEARIEQAASLIQQEVESGKQVAVVVSAMGKTTDQDRRAHV